MILLRSARLGAQPVPPRRTPQGRQNANLLVRTGETLKRPNTGGPGVLTISWELAIGAGRSVAHSTHLTLQWKMDSMKKSRFEGGGTSYSRRPGSEVLAKSKLWPWKSYSESLRGRMGTGRKSLEWNGKGTFTGLTPGIASGLGFSHSL